jgi:TonB family protein
MVKIGKMALLVLLLICGTVVAQRPDPGPNIEDKAVKRVAPVYPPLAKRKRVQGKVVVWLQVGTDGAVSDMDFVEGNALFKPASMEAAKQWAFQRSSSGTSGHIVFRFQLEEQ